MEREMRILLAALIALLVLSACDTLPFGLNSEDPAFDLASSGVNGEVWMGPMQPVVTDASGAQNYVLVEWDLSITASGNSATLDVRSAEDGTFSIPLEPGSYRIEAASPTRETLEGLRAETFPIADPVDFVVVEGGWVQIRIDIDTGIR
jgi:hypothetical protein